MYLLLYLLFQLLFCLAFCKLLIDSGASINLIHEQVCSFLSLPVTPCQGPKVSLADGSTVLSCSGVVKLSYSIANVSMQHTFFVANIGVQSMILGMPFLVKENPLVDWVAKSLTWRTKSPLPYTPSPSPLPALPPSPPPSTSSPPPPFISYLTSRLLASCAATSLSSRHSTLLSLSTPFEVSTRNLEHVLRPTLPPASSTSSSIQSHRLGSPRCR